MKAHGPAESLLDGQVPIPQELGQELAVMDNLEFPTKLGILVLQRVEAVWTGGHNFFHLVPVQGRNVFLGQELKKILIADPPGRISRAALFIAQDRELHPSRFQHLRHGPTYLLPAFVKSACTADPVQEIHLFFEFRRFGDQESLGPIGPAGTHPFVRMPTGLQVPECLPHLLWKPCLFHHQVPTHVQNLGNRLDIDWTGFMARPAHGTGPENILGDHLADHLPGLVAAVYFGQMVPEIQDDPLRGERFPSGPCRTGVLASPALGARVQIQERLLGEVPDGRGPQPLFLHRQWAHDA